MAARSLRAVVLALCAGALLVAACRFTDGLSGGGALAVVEEAGQKDADAASPACDANLSESIANCGACGHTCEVGANALAACIDGGCVMGCASGSGDCDDAGANGCETNLTNNRKSCGRCGHDCLGGPCVLGVCQPVTLSSGVHAPVHIAIDATYVYGINVYGAVTRVAKDGGAPTDLVSGDNIAQTPAPRIALSGGYVYYTDFDTGGDAGSTTPRGAVLRVPVDGGTSSVLAAATEPYAVVAGAQGVYWTEGSPSASMPSGTIKHCLPADCAPETLRASEDGRFFGLAIDALNLYWTNGGTLPNAGPASVVGKCALESCAASTLLLATNPAGPSAIVVDGTAAYWMTTSGYLASCLLGGCSNTATRIDLSQYNPRFLTLTTTNVYWTSGDGTVKTIPKNGLPSAEKVVFQDRTASPWDIALDSTAIYFTDMAGVAGQPGPALRKLAR